MFHIPFIIFELLFAIILVKSIVEMYSDQPRFVNFLDFPVSGVGLGTTTVLHAITYCMI
jgi:hypothetical protein